MRNLILNEKLVLETGIKNGLFTAIDSLNEIVYLASKNEVFGYNTIMKECVCELSLEKEGYLSQAEDDRIVAFNFLQDQESLCIITSKGDVLLWQHEMDSLENVGSVEAGFTNASWSSDQELLVLTTKQNTLIVMTRDFDPINEFPIHSDDFGEAQQVNVGWGSKETQFHGSEGKEAAKVQKIDTSSPVLPTDDRRTEISWRGDGQYFSISSINPASDSRCIRIFNNEGILQATNEKIEGLEQCIGWRTSGNLIACSQQKPNKHDVIFFEKNGLQHGEFTLSSKPNDKLIKQILWNPNSDILTLLIQDLSRNGKFSVQLWTTGNYHWYLKQELTFNEQPPSLSWDPENAYKLHIISQDGEFKQFVYIYDVIQSKGDDENLAMVAVIDGSQLLLTPFRQMVLPPPMAAHTISLDACINQLAFGVNEQKHDILIKTSHNLVFAKFDRKNNSYTTQKLTVVEGDENTADLSKFYHLVFLKDGFVAGLEVSNECTKVVLLQLNEDGTAVTKRSHLDMNETRIMKLFKSEDTDCQLLIQYSNGSVKMLNYLDGALNYGNLDELTLPHSCDSVASREINGKRYVFGLTSHFRLFMNDKEIANNCTSFFIHDDFLLLTTHAHSLRCVYIKSLETQLDNIAFDEASRRVERGSKLVTAVMQGTAVVLQMPRGNLECIHPRPLVITHLQKLLNSLHYKQALEIMRKHRINLNLVYDNDPQLFLKNVDTFVNNVNSSNRINLFLADLSAEDVCSSLYFPYYHHSEENKESNKAKSSPTKVNEVCKAVREAIKRSPNAEKLMLSILTTYVRQSEPDLQTVLIKIKELKDNPSLNKSVTYEKALSYIIYLVDVNQLFDIALGLYDFDVVIMVAEKSQKDPKEYLPFLNNFKNMEENYRKFSIDKYLKKNTQAIQHLVKCAEGFEELLDFVTQHDLYKEAIKLYKHTTEEFKKLSFLYGQYLHRKKYYEEAAIIFSRCGYHEESIDSLLHTDNWNMALMESRLNGDSQDKFIALCRKFSERLKNHRKYLDAAIIQEQYLKDMEESMVCLLEGNLWFQALNLIQRSEREDLIETNFKPAILECQENLTEKITELKETFNKHRTRLQIVIANKEQERLEILEGIRDDPQNELYSDTSSITGQSAVSSTSSRSSKGTRTSGHSRKSKAKGERKKYSLREGSTHEDFALREALAEIVNTADGMKDEVESLSKVLLLHYYDEKAKELQNCLDSLIVLVEKHKKEIWAGETKETNSESFEYGPASTVMSIIERKNAAQNAGNQKSDLPEPTRPNLRSNFKWKLTTIST
ncbi:putative elongator complex protein 1 isoform X2 [Clytia hemisphaerica]|uniref:putative elongator complex protein 1 isoform X2 n=1 Tax=Clytia hemisphaerica TaxID=252671 RepID=UPI0034D4200B